MDSRLLLIKIITLLYKESLVGDSSGRSNELAREAIQSIKLPESVIEMDKSREILVALRSTALWMVGHDETAFDRDSLLQRIRVNVADEEGLFYAVEQATDPSIDKEILKRQAMELRQELRSYLTSFTVTDIVKKASQKLMFSPDQVDWKNYNFVKQLVADLEPYATHTGEEKIPGMVDEVDVSDTAGMADIMSRASQELSNEGVLRFGNQAVNRMFGEHGGMRRGEALVVGALQHNFKTGQTLGMFEQAALYNVPYLRDKTKRPLLLHISLENQLTDNIMWLYINLKENETGEACDISKVDIEEATRYVHQRLSANGYHIKMCRMNPSDVTYRTVFDYIQKLESDGYEIHLLVIDYLNMMDKKGTVAGAAGQEVRDLFRRMRNFTSARGIAFITPHQLSTEAKALVRQGVENFVQEIANKGYYDSCRTIDQEVDMEIYIHIVKVDGRSYLTMQRGKHRKPTITPQKDLYCVLPFSDVGGIRHDINGKDISVKYPGGGAVGSDDEKPWWVN